MRKTSIKLLSPITIDGIKRDTLMMREPTFGDVLDITKIEPKDETRQEMLMFSRLADISPDDVRNLTARDINRVRKVYLRLVEPGESDDEGIVEIDAPAG